MRLAVVMLAAVVASGAACGGEPRAQVPVELPPEAVAIAARLPRAPGEHGPSLVAIDRSGAGSGVGEATDGAMLSDVDSCASCHPDAAKQ